MGGLFGVLLAALCGKRFPSLPILYFVSFFFHTHTHVAAAQANSQSSFIVDGIIDKRTSLPRGTLWKVSYWYID